MTIAIDWDVKHQTKQTKSQGLAKFVLFRLSVGCVPWTGATRTMISALRQENKKVWLGELTIST